MEGLFTEVTTYQVATVKADITVIVMYSLEKFVVHNHLPLGTTCLLWPFRFVLFLLFFAVSTRPFTLG